MKMACILLASGKSERFGENKLLVELEGKTLFEQAMDAIPVGVFDEVVVVTAYEKIADMANARGFETVMNPRPEDGLSLTIRLGLESVENMDACMFCVCDQPYLNVGSIKKMAEDYDGGIHMLAFGKRRGNPAIFPKELFGELMSLEPGEAGVAVVNRHADMLKLDQAGSALELEDVDTESDFAKLQRKPGGTEQV